MKVIVSKYAGFCPGVKRADKGVRAALEKSGEGGLVFTIGELIHNGEYCRELAERGAVAIDFCEVNSLIESNPDKHITFVIRAHGLPKNEVDILTALSEQNERISLLDLTCPSVRRIHKIAEEETDEGTLFLLLGSPSHPENIGTLSRARGEKLIISDEKDLKNIVFDGKLTIFCAQTTENLSKFIKIKKLFKKVCTNAKIFDTICSVSENRQNEAEELSRRADAMIVIGGRDSSNTEKLYRLCRENCPNTVWIERADEIPPSFAKDINIMGITAGASTPDGIILEVLKTYGKL